MCKFKIPWVALGSRDSPRSPRARDVSPLRGWINGLEAELVASCYQLRSLFRVILRAAIVWISAMHTQTRRYTALVACTRSCVVRITVACCLPLNDLALGRG